MESYFSFPSEGRNTMDILVFLLKVEKPWKDILDLKHCKFYQKLIKEKREKSISYFQLHIENVDAAGCPRLGPSIHHSTEYERNQEIFFQKSLKLDCLL